MQHDTIKLHSVDLGAPRRRRGDSLFLFSKMLLMCFVFIDSFAEKFSTSLSLKASYFSHAYLKQQLMPDNVAVAALVLD